MKAEILSIGTELLLGEILNTNAQFLATELAALGISVYYQTTVGDNPERLREAYNLAFSRSDIVITSGGLGPTDDDLSKEVAAQFFNKKMIEDIETLNKIKAIFKTDDIPKNNIKQAYFPENSIILKNDNGTAPGVYIEEQGKILILLPGPPSELIPIFKNEVYPILSKIQNCILFSRTLKIFGTGESAVEMKIKDLIDKQTTPTIATYADVAGVKVRLTASASTIENAEKLIQPVAEEIYKRLGDDIYGEQDDTLESVLCKKLKENGYKLAIAESCTCGMLVSTIANESGISETLLEGIVTYSNESKIKRLSVKEKTLDQFGAVSSQTALEMAQGAAKFLDADIAISTTGIAGPTGGTPEKPIGLVYIGLYLKGELYYKKCNFSGNRQKIREKTVLTAMDFVLRHL